MKLTKKLENEILAVLEDYWGSYFRGDLQAWASYLPENYGNIGTTNEEVWRSKKEMIDYTLRVSDQVVGSIELRNKSTRLISYEPFIMAHELGDTYVKAEEGWVFYAPFRLSSLLNKTDEGWKILHQHGSLPDSKAEEGEAFGFEQLKIENKNLRDAIQSRTIELERNNRELEIEAALERIRTLAMGMERTEDLGGIARAIFHELKTLGFEDLRNVEVIVDQSPKPFITSYHYSDYGITGVVNIDYRSHPKLLSWVNEQNQKQDSFVRVHVEAGEIKEWEAFRQSIGYKPDPKLSGLRALDYYTYSVGPGAISISSFESIHPSQTEILERFRNVFDLAYRRYADVSKALVQAREAEIQLALERIRARSMAMQSSQEQRDIVMVLFEQVQSLGVADRGCTLLIVDESAQSMQGWFVDSQESKNPSRFQTSDKSNKIIQKFWEFYHGKDEVLSVHLEGEEKREYAEFLLTHTEMRNMSDEVKELIMSEPEIYFDFTKMKFGSLQFINSDPFSEDEKEIFKRITRTFEQAYIRFLDVQKAEAQAREAEIQLALERVRARTMAMHSSNELSDAASVLFQQILSLGLKPIACGFVIIDKKDKSGKVYISADGTVIPNSFVVPYHGEPAQDQIYNSWISGQAYILLDLKGEALKTHLEFLVKNMPVDEMLKTSGDAQPDRLVLHIINFNYGFLGINYPEPHEELIPVLQRFAKVFEQTYTRFSDLQKAESQAREAQIEAALERIRSRTMAMHKSDDLREAVRVLFEELKLLGFDTKACGIILYDKKNRTVTNWISGFTQNTYPQSYTHRFFDHPYFIEQVESWDKGIPFKGFVFEGQLKKEYDEIIFSLDELKIFPEDARNEIASTDKLVLSDAFMKYGALEVFSEDHLAAAEAIILQRFAKVFEQTYTRFRDLQKAEDQAQEAQIEAALERVRSRSMAMHKSDELSEVATVLYRELIKLEISEVYEANIVIIDEKNSEQLVYASQPEALNLEMIVLPLLGDQVLDDIYKNWQKKKAFYSRKLAGDELRNHQDFVLPELYRSEAIELAFKAMPDPTYFNCAYFNMGYLELVTNEEISSSSISILTRFAKVFQQSYIRFLDLQKSEAQAREAQIEAALERIRAASNAMYHSEDLPKVALVLLNQMQELGIKELGSSINILNEDKKSFTRYSADPDLETGERIVRRHPESPVDAMWVSAEAYRRIKSGEMYFSVEASGEHLNEFIDFTIRQIGEDRGLKSLNRLYFHFFVFSPGSPLASSTIEPLTDGEKSILQRVALTFGQAYRRFVDLQKAEEQTREAQIQLALERIRARSMAMNESLELREVIQVMYNEVEKLGISKWGCLLMLFDKEKKVVQGWFSEIVNKQYAKAFNFKDIGHPLIQKWWEFWDSNEEIMSVCQKGKEKHAFADYLFEHTDLKDLPAEVKDSIYSQNEVYFEYVNAEFGLIEFIDIVPFPEESRPVLIRITKAFQQAYTRFLDLKVAEAQAKEAQIQLALERVRARTMAMQSSDELAEVSYLLNKQVVDLGIPTRGCAFHIYNENDSTEWFSSLQGTLPGYTVPRENIFLKYYEAGRKGESLWIEEFRGKRIKEHYSYLSGILVDNKTKEHVLRRNESIPDYQLDHVAYFKYGYLLFITLEQAPEAHEIFKRFAKEFEQTYTRFLDIKMVEARAREARIEAGLERVRSRTMAMQTSQELPEAANTLFLQIQSLGIPAWSAGYCIWDDKTKLTSNCWMSSEGVLHKPFCMPSIGVGYDFLSPALRGDEFYVAELGGDELVKHYEFMASLPIFGEMLNEINEAGFPTPTFQIFHVVFIPVGFLMFITYEPVQESHDVFIRFARVFEQTYTRFLDLQEKEEQSRSLAKEKIRLENTLKDLQATQKQLIQAEKMASLGELTAGIAHEIQNPLNFVNNFSELSNELLEELKEELVSGNTEEVMAITGDLRQNLEKINHHGKRAENIVKGMLQHSRTSTGIKEPTDINALCDEYLRLAYHGMRAKDKSFNAKYECDFDPSLPKIEVIPQDIGRVLLNLINNGFQAISEVENPQLTIRTAKTSSSFGHRSLGEGDQEGIGGVLGGVLITVADNGPGIPEGIRDKIFQPFFTTKPTGQGTGLGLSLSYDIVKAHEGDLKVESKEGEGSKFIIQLPI